jgi:hypothetical protein
MTSLQTKITLFSFLSLYVFYSCLAIETIEEGGNANGIDEQWRLATATYVRENHQLSTITGTF